MESWVAPPVGQSGSAAIRAAWMLRFAGTGGAMDLMHSLARLAGRLLRPIHAGDDKLSIVKQPAEHTIKIESSTFKDQEAIPAEHAGVRGRSPALSWSNVPSAAQELVLITEDPDAPLPRPFVHWTVYGIPPQVTSLDAGLTPGELPSGAIQGTNSARRQGYLGPEPPPNHGVHHYHFQLFALDRALELRAPVDRDRLLEAMKGHVLATGELVGTYERN
jgi:Raf kinase inhibitor-like YbhB/YbcL family protein